MVRSIAAEPLTRAAFSPFGDVIEKAGAGHFNINDGMAARYHDLARVDTTQDDGHTAINIFHGRPWALPLLPTMMERHNLGSQAFIPLGPCRWLVVVAGQRDFDPGALRAFTADGQIGVNYRPGVWHHPLVVLASAADFLVVDRVGPKVDCDVVDLPAGSVEITTTA